MSCDVNDTIFLPCQASFSDAERDLAYKWSLNDIPLDWRREGHVYHVGRRGGVSGLYIVGAQLRHSGRYTCTATTVDYSSSESGYLHVRGPPGECAGVVGYVTDQSISLYWKAGPDHGDDIKYFTIYANTYFKPKWKLLRDYVNFENVSVTSSGGTRHKSCRLTIDNLKPGSSYRFKISATNKYGTGPMSLPSGLYTVADAAPVVAVTGIREGSSTVGTLPIEWDALDEEDLTGKGIGYKVYYRRQDLKRYSHWHALNVYGNTNVAVPFIGAQNYFLPYEVMIAPFNALGVGPNSSVVTVMSAEDTPIAAASGVTGDTINATAIKVYWTPVPNIRRYIRGRVLGYQVNFWTFSESYTSMGGVNIYCDNCGEGLLIGMDVDEDFWLNVQVCFYVVEERS